MRRIIGNLNLKIFFVFVNIFLIFLIFNCSSIGQVSENQDSKIIGEIKETEVGLTGSIRIDGIGTFRFDPRKIQSTRRDIFNKGHFSLFDILVYLDQKEEIQLEYHFDETMNTHVIDSINSQSNWWYNAYYDGGWPECNVYRMDHYPYKDKMFIRVHRENENTINEKYDVFREEIIRIEKNNGIVIIPRVIIRSPSQNLIFEDVQVKAHHLRDDIFKEGYITAIDVIMSLGDQEKISYDLQWHESIGTAEIVKNYYVERINQDQSRGRCGFVYEAGSEKFSGFRGNHIHIPSDIRGINSPEYVEYFWICL